MSQRLPPKVLQEIRSFAAQWGKIVTRRAFGEAGPGTDIDFDAMEQVAQAAADGLTEGTLTTLLELQAQALGNEQPCPACGRLRSLHREPRALTLRGGQLLPAEPVGHCPVCRRDFFPSTAAAPSGCPRLQSCRPADDR